MTLFKGVPFPICFLRAARRIHFYQNSKFLFVKTMADQDNKSNVSRPESLDREEYEDENGDDENFDDDIDDVDDDEADADIDTHNGVDESGRDDEDDDDDDDMDVNDDSNMNDPATDIDGEDSHIKEDDAHETTVTPNGETSLSLQNSDQRQKGATTIRKQHPRKGMKGPRGGGGNTKRNSTGANGISSRTPSVRGLTIPFRTIKKSMKLDPDIPIVQNEAAIMATVAVKLFLKRLVTQSHRNAKNRGRNTVRYEDVAEARTNDKALAFLEILLP